MKFTYKTIIFMLVAILVCSSLLTLLILNVKPIIVGQRIEYGIKYSLPDGLELYRSDFDPSYYTLAQAGKGQDEIDVIVSLLLDDDLNPESISILGYDPQLIVILDWENREIASIMRCWADGSMIIDKDGDGMPDIRGGPSQDREIFFEGQWRGVEIGEEKFIVKLPDDEVVPVEFRDGKWRRTED